MPATGATRNRLLFFLFLLWPFTVLMKKTRQVVCTIKQSIFLNVYEQYIVRSNVVRTSILKSNVVRTTEDRNNIVIINFLKIISL